MNTEQEKAWAGEHGNAYTARNRVLWHDRASFWALVLDLTKARSVLEVGCNAGANLRAISHVAGKNGIFVHGCDINAVALAEARGYGVDVECESAANVGARWPNCVELVVTAGLLIHVPPEQLPEVMISIIAASRRYVLAVEYEAEQEEMIEYRGEKDLLWRRPFGRLYEGLGLTPVLTMDAGPGFDRCTAWLLSKEKP